MNVLKGIDVSFTYIKNGKERKYCGTYSKIHCPNMTLNEFIEYLKKKYVITSEIKTEETEFVCM